MPEHRYRVRATCVGIVTETWTVTSPEPLTREQICELVYGADIDGVTAECQSEEVSDEHDRTIDEVTEL